MPLIILTGYPSSGKTTRSFELKEYIEKLKKKVHLVSENEVISTLDYDKNAVCFDSAKEKEVRSMMKSSAQRLIGREDVVILDAANYIKGYRYELYCMSKSSKTTQCTLHCAATADEAWAWNSQRSSISNKGDQPYCRASFDALVMRYEAADAKNRWDSPLFAVFSTMELPFDEIVAALFDRKPPPPNQSTQCAPLSATNYLHDLDRITQEISEAILSAQNSNIGDVKLPGYMDLTVHIGGNKLTAAQLGRSRRQFLTYSKMHPSSDTSQIGYLFVQYLNSSLLR